MTATLIIFVLVYVGMLLGGVPYLQLDRTGIALLGAIALIVSRVITLEEAGAAIHMPTLILLFSFMVIAAQLRLGGFYDWITFRLGEFRLGPASLLAALIAVVGALAAVFSNDVVCLSMAPVLIDACERRRLDSVPFLLALACAANIGSAATLIGNPQNILIGEHLDLSFRAYLGVAAVPVVVGLVLTWSLIVWRWRGRWCCLPRATVEAVPRTPPRSAREQIWQAAKGLSVAAALLGLFLASDWHREIAALGGAGLLLLSRKLHSREMLGLVDWQVLLLFIGLFVVNDALQRTSLPQEAVAALAALGIDLQQPVTLYVMTFMLSNLVSNVPAVMLLLPFATPADGIALALSSTLAGNLLVVGSIANIIVLNVAASRGIAIGWKEHAAVGVPVTLATLVMAAGWVL